MPKGESKYLQCKSIDTAISRAKEMLIKRAKKRGMYENFGVDEAREIKEKFIDISNYYKEMNLNRIKLENFINWCDDYMPE